MRFVKLGVYALSSVTPITLPRFFLEYDLT